jgi:type IV pilus assembly protein PilM
MPLENVVQFLKSQKSLTTVGLDIGSYAVKCVEVNEEGGRVSLRSAQVRKIAQGGAEEVKSAVRSVCQSLTSTPAHVRISVAGPSVLIRNVSLPRMTLQELKSAIRFEAERHIPFPIDDCILDFQILDQAPGKPTMKVLLVAAKKDLVNQRVRTLSDAGIEPEAIDADIFCYANAFERLSENGGVKSFGLLNIGHRSSSFAIMHGGSLFFARDVLFGGLGVTKALMETKGLPEPEADELKLRREEAVLADLAAATKKGFEPLAAELKRSVVFFENETGEELGVIYVAGGGARSHGAAEALSEELGRKVALWSAAKPFGAGPGVDPQFLEKHFLELGIAYGLALRGLKGAL